MSTSATCPRCNANLNSDANFCSNCGKRVGGNQPYASKTLGFVIMGILACCLVGWLLAFNLAGDRPRPQFRPAVQVGSPAQSGMPSEMAESGAPATADQGAANSPAGAMPPMMMNFTPVDDPALNPLRAELNAAPQDPTKLHNFAEALLNKLQNSSEPSQDLSFETVTVLRRLLAVAPQDKFALKTLADISFDRQLFDKAAELYKRYLEVAPDDHLTRTTYASSLSFLGQTEAAMSELNLILAKEPNNFHALAYLSITQAQAGDRESALKTAEHALKFAPSDEARARFGDFVSSLKAEAASGQPAAN